MRSRCERMASQREAIYLPCYDSCPLVLIRGFWLHWFIPVASLVELVAWISALEPRNLLQ